MSEIKCSKCGSKKVECSRRVFCILIRSKNGLASGVKVTEQITIKCRKCNHIENRYEEKVFIIPENLPAEYMQPLIFAITQYLT